MNKHTPGPWIGAGPSFGEPLPRYTTEIVTELEADEGDVISICEMPFNHHDETNEANARLIAAAPELLEACCLGHADIPGLPTGDLLAAANILRNAGHDALAQRLEEKHAAERAAIAKATQ